MRNARMPKKPFIHSFARLRRDRFVSNIFAENALIPEAEYGRYRACRAVAPSFAGELMDKMFFSDYMDLEKAAAVLADRFFAEWKGPRVHVISVTKRCNSFCSYCGASSSPMRPLESDMDMETADRTADFIFSVPGKEFMLEFQGGEPLLNFGAIKRIVERAEKIKREKGLSVSYSIVTNLAEMNGEILAFIRKHRIVVCTSLDGPAKVHDFNRKLTGGSSHAHAVKWLSRLNALAIKGKIPAPAAICTVSRAALPYPREIADEFLKVGLLRIQTGPLDRTGRAKIHWEKVGYTPAEFLDFYRRLFDYILALNRKGIKAYEKGSFMFIKQMMTGERPRHHNLDLLMRLAYNWDGSVYGSDEARMLSNSGDERLKLGNVAEGGFRDIVSGPAARMLLLADFNILTQPKCSRCPWAPYCHIMPALNISSQNSFWGNMALSDRCAVYSGIFGMLAGKMKKKENRRIFERWLSLYEN